MRRGEGTSGPVRLPAALAPVLLSLVVSWTQPALADQAPAQSTYEQMQASAQPFKKVDVNKGRVWLLFVLGASSLFGVTVLVENNGAWFPAIAKANRAMKASLRAMEEREKMEKAQGTQETQETLETLGTLGAQETQETLGAMEDAWDVAESNTAVQSTQEAVLAGIRQASVDAKQTIRSMREDTVPAMMPLELRIDDEAGQMEEGGEALLDRAQDKEEEDFDDIGSLLDDPIPGSEEEIMENVVAMEGTEQEPLQEDTRKPLFEISGEAIDASISSREEQLKEAKEAASKPAIDLSNISLEELQKELEKRNQ